MRDTFDYVALDRAESNNFIPLYAGKAMVTKAEKKPSNQDMKKVVGANVKRLRTGAGITQQVLADQSGIFRSYLSRAENGFANMTVSVIAELAKNLKVDIRELFNE